MIEKERIAEKERREMYEQYNFLMEIIKKEGTHIIGMQSIRCKHHVNTDYIVTNSIEEDDFKIEFINLSYPLMNNYIPSLEYSLEQNYNTNNEEASYHVKMKFICVKDEDRRKGIGSALINHFKAYIKDMSITFGSKTTHISGSLPRYSDEKEVSELKDFYIRNGFEYIPSNDHKTNGYIKYTFDI